MPHRDPETGQFVAGHSRDSFADIEVVTFKETASVSAADLDGTTGQGGGQSFTSEGDELIDYDEIVDRNESLVLLEATHRLSAYINSTSTADGTVRAVAEVSSGTAQALDYTLQAGSSLNGDNVDGATDRDDSIDLIGRPLQSMGYGGITDGTNGVGGAGSTDADEVRVVSPPDAVAQFHPRDEVFANLQLTQWNVDDAAIHADLVGQHVYGVVNQ